MQKNFYDPFSNNENINLYVDKETYLEKLKKETIQKKQIISIGFSLGFGIILCLIMQTFMTMLLKKFNMDDMYLENSVFFSAFNSLAISTLSIALPFGLIAIFNKKYFITPLIPTKKISFSKIFIYVNFGMFACIMINLFVGWIIILAEQLGYKLESPEGPQLNSVLACIMLVISTAIMPAICEEFSMRCCAMGLLRKHGKAFAVFAVSLIFGLLHGNVIQFIFAFLVGIVLAFVTIKTDNILPAMLIHGLNNGRSVLYDIVEYASSTEIADKVITGVTYFFIITGIICTIILFLFKGFKLKKDNNPDDVLPFSKKVLYLMPGLALPLLLLIATTITTITKI